MIFGVLYFVFGFMFLAIPVIGWIVGPLFIIVGILKIIMGIISAITPDSVTEKVIIKENIVYKNDETNQEASMADELGKLSELFEKGMISEDEFNSSKKRIINPYSRD